MALAIACAASALERPPAEPFLGLPQQSTLGSGTAWDVVPAYPDLAFDDPVFLLREPGADRLWVAEREGRLLSFEDDEDADELRTVLDLRDVTQGDGDSGMLSMAFHPGYAGDDPATQGLVFVAYARREKDDDDAPLRFRLSRFRVDPATGIADPASEAILIEQLDQNVWHQGGALFFHPVDGFLYVSVGDEGGGRCQYGNCQRIDRDLFSGVLRLDVDCRPGASHAPPRQPNTGTTAHYCIPDDNPFVGEPGVLEEFYALGLRSPHRMTHDAVDDLAWIGDVGQSQREEIDVLAAGANYQWNVMEGDIPFNDESEVPDPVVGTWTGPVHAYGRLSGGTVIGGYVYRGKALPELEGRYVYGDFLSGRIWALSYVKTVGGVSMTANEHLVRTDLRGREDGITSFGLDGDGEILVLSLGEPATLRRLVASRPDTGDMPTTLSATGLFEDLEALTPVEALVPYDVKVPLWSDGAHKKRWMSVPSGATIDYSPTGPWGFPDGSVFVKHFELLVDDDDPSSLRRLETRVLVRASGGGLYGLTYRWREDGGDADLLTGPQYEDIVVNEGEANERELRYLYPGPGDCVECHAVSAGGLLGLRARQLAGADPGDDQLEALADSGFLDVGTHGLARSFVPAFAPLGDESAGLALRVRSYVDANCSHCHGSQALDRSLWDARITTPLHRQGIVGGAVLGDYGDDDHRVVVADRADLSVMHLRAGATAASLRMPPLARSAVDEDFLAVLDQWIDELEPGMLPQPVCGDAVDPWDARTAADALAVLRAAVGLAGCEPCICDVDGSGSNTVTDALKVLRSALGSPQALACPACPA